MTAQKERAKETTALQVFLFKGDLFMGTELFSCRAPLTVGRCPGAGLRLDGDTVSRRHCRLTLDKGALLVEDLRSGNGTFVNDERMSGRRILAFSDTVRVGVYSLKVRPIHASGPVPFDPIAAVAATRLERKPADASRPAVATNPLPNEDTETEVDRLSRAPTPGPDELAARQRELSAVFIDLGADEASAATDTARDGATSESARGVERTNTAPPDRAVAESAAASSFESADVLTFAEVVAAQLEKEGALRNIGPLVADDAAPARRLPDIVHQSRLMTPTDQKVDVRPVASRSGRRCDPQRSRQRRSTTVASPVFLGVEVAARAQGRLRHIALLRTPGDEYVLGYPSPQGRRTPARRHVGLRLLKINEDRTVDLVFPDDVAGYLVRGGHTVLLPSLTAGRKYSCLRLEPDDVAVVHVGRGRDRISYHLRFLKRPASVLRDLMRARHS